jgi:outer membrane protein assembly factor BamB
MLKGQMADYSTPCIFEPEGGEPLLIFNSKESGIAGFDPGSGRKVWEYASAFDKRSVSSPIVASGLLIGSCGSGGGGHYLVAVKPGDASGNKKPQLAYEIRRSAPYVPTSVAVGDLLFLWSDAGVASCVHAPSGEIRWQERVGGNFFGSPIWVDGRIFCVSASGEVVVLDASERFQVLARNPLDELAHTTPAVAGGRMYIRTAGHLVSVGGKPAAQ